MEMGDAPWCGGGLAAKAPSTPGSRRWFIGLAPAASAPVGAAPACAPVVASRSSRWRRRGSCSREQGTWELSRFGDHGQRRQHRAEKRPVGARWVGAFVLVRSPPEQIVWSMPLPSQAIRSGRGVCRPNRHAFIGVI
ncbi:hypothetical protein VPH35_121924 [Triticum aestivum]